jgi:RNA polymerase sigma factor (sigma-70 family)
VAQLEQDFELLKGLITDDKKAINTIYKEHFPVIQGFIQANNGSYDEARDIFQEAIIIVYEKAKTADFVLTCQLRTYIYSICRRLWLKRLQQISVYAVKTEFLEDTVPVDDEIELHKKKDADFAIMEQAMAKIGEPCKSLLEAYYIEKKHMTEIADQFGYTNADNAKTQKYKCLTRLKKLFFAQYKNEQ